MKTLQEVLEINAEELNRKLDLTADLCSCEFDLSKEEYASMIKAELFKLWCKKEASYECIN